MSLSRLLEILDRAHSGKICSVEDWDVKVVPRAIMEKLRKYELFKSCDPENPINCNDELADRFFKAGLELALELGILCIDTERVIQVTEQELMDSIENALAQIKIGSGDDEVNMRSRVPEDPTQPVFISPLGIVVSENLWVPLMQGIAELPEVDVMQGGSLDTVFGSRLIGGTPYETLAGRVQAQMHREALWRAGRPGMPATAVIASTTVYGQLGGYGIPGGFDASKDLALCLAPAELKTTYHTLHKVVHALNSGGRVLSGTCSMIGGYAGPPEGAVLANIAFALLQYVVHQADCGGAAMIDVRYGGNCGRDAQWAISVAVQALSRNTHLLINAIANEVAGPCTPMILYEAAVGMMNLAVSGTTMSIGPRSAGGKFKDYLTPLETKLCGEVFKKCASMTRSEANRIAKSLIPKYEDQLSSPPKGKSFSECYDVISLKPNAEWAEIYATVKQELVELGMPLV